MANKIIGDGNIVNKGAVIIACLGIIICAVLIIGMFLTPTVYVYPDDSSSQTSETPALVYYTMSFNTGGVYTVPNQLVEAGKAANTPSIPTREGYYFDGWYTESGSLWNFNNGVSRDMTLTARWTAISSSGQSNVQDSVPPQTPTVPEVVLYSVTFYTGGAVEAPVPQSVIKGETAVEPQIPARDGYQFDGWFSNGARYAFSTPVYGDLMLTARWTPLLGTQTNPVLIDTPEELVQMTAGTYYRLSASIDLSAYPDFPYQNYNLDVAGYIIGTNGLGTAASPYLIRTSDEFLMIFEKPTAHFKLMNDITLTARSLPADVTFRGVLDGGNHKISAGNCIINIGNTAFPSEKAFGIFSINAGEIRNVVFDGFIIHSAACHDGATIHTGVVCGINNGVISGVTVQNSDIWVNRLLLNIGYVAGKNSENGVIENSCVNGGSLYSNGETGGVTGTNHGRIQHVTVIGNGGTSGSEPLLHYEETAIFKYLGYNGRSVGFICGNTGPTGVVQNVHVQDARMQCQTALDQCYFGIYIGWNNGRLESYSASSIHPESLAPVSANSGYVA